MLLNLPLDRLILDMQLLTFASQKQYHESQGVKFHMSSKVSKLVPSSTDPSAVGSVVVAGPSGEETTLEADFVVMGVGVGPATKFLKDSGWELERDGGVRVDEYLRVVGKENVYAIGDIAHYPQAETGEVRRIEHWNVSSLLSQITLYPCRDNNSRSQATMDAR